jgi:hypothetical protein
MLAICIIFKFFNNLQYKNINFIQTICRSSKFRPNEKMAPPISRTKYHRPSPSAKIQNPRLTPHHPLGLVRHGRRHKAARVQPLLLVVAATCPVGFDLLRIPLLPLPAPPPLAPLKLDPPPPSWCRAQGRKASDGSLSSLCTSSMRRPWIHTAYRCLKRKESHSLVF